MHLDVLTLIVAGSFVALISATVLAGAWFNMGHAPALKWWAGSMYIFGAGVGCIALGIATRWPGLIIEGGFLSSASTALIWAGTRAFHGRPTYAVPLTAGFFIWSTAVSLLITARGSEVATYSGFVISLALLLATQYELWRGRAEGLTARWGLIALLALHAIILTGGLYDSIHPHAPMEIGPQLNSWFGLINFEGMIFAVAAPILMVTLCRERVTLDYERVSQIDPLTGIANRRALFAGAERLLDRCRATDSPFSVIEFDLDGFKAVNDTHGHAVGDAVLRTFTDTIRGVLRPNDFFGRHGGEEFAVILPGTTLTAAYAIAERARHAFAETGREVSARQVFATVSAGVAEMQLGQNFGDVLDAADRALYRAKSHGRNRVERIEPASADDEPVARIA